MNDPFVWIDESTLVNLQSAAYVKLETQEARIVFADGEKVTVDAEHFQDFREYLRNEFKNEANARWTRSDPERV